jgi:FtsZ-binding cell division protein ZapB
VSFEVHTDEFAPALSAEELPSRGVSLPPIEKDRFYGNATGVQVETELKRLGTLLRGLLRDFEVVKHSMWHLEECQDEHGRRLDALERRVPLMDSMNSWSERLDALFGKLDLVEGIGSVEDAHQSRAVCGLDMSTEKEIQEEEKVTSSTSHEMDGSRITVGARPSPSPLKMHLLEVSPAQGTMTGTSPYPLDSILTYISACTGSILTPDGSVSLAREASAPATPDPTLLAMREGTVSETCAGSHVQPEECRPGSQSVAVPQTPHAAGVAQCDGPHLLAGDGSEVAGSGDAVPLPE